MKRQCTLLTSLSIVSAVSASGLIEETNAAAAADGGGGGGAARFGRVGTAGGERLGLPSAVAAVEMARAHSSALSRVQPMCKCSHDPRCKRERSFGIEPNDMIVRNFAQSFVMSKRASAALNPCPNMQGATTVNHVILATSSTDHGFKRSTFVCNC